MIEIKQSRRLHGSGYRLMEISSDGEVINTHADVIHIHSGNMFDGLNIDITKNGIIRIWSHKFDLEPDRTYRYSDSFFKLIERGKQ